MLVKFRALDFVMRHGCRRVSFKTLETEIISPPLDFPVSINELALRPRMPRLLLRAAFVFLISLFRRMIGVSANGRAIFVASNETSIGCVWSCCGSCLTRSLSAWDLSLPGSGLCSLGARSLLLFLTGKGGGSAFPCSPLCRVLLLFAG